jgi:hypothetical protein
MAIPAFVALKLFSTYAAKNRLSFSSEIFEPVCLSITFHPLPSTRKSVTGAKLPVLLSTCFHTPRRATGFHHSSVRLLL